MLDNTRDFLTVVVQTTVILGGASGLVGWVWRKVSPAIETLNSTSESIVLVSAKQSKMETIINNTVLPALDKLEKEIATNGSTVSVKDKVAMVEVIVNTIQDGQLTATYRCDKSGKCIYSNHSLQRLFGLSADDMKHFGWAGVVVPEEREMVVSKWLHCVAEGTPYEATYHIINALSGNRLKVKTYANPVRHGGTGAVVLWSGSVIVEERAPHGQPA